MIRIKIERLNTLPAVEGNYPRVESTLLLEQNLPDDQFGLAQMWAILTALNGPKILVSSTTPNTARTPDAGSAGN